MVNVLLGCLIALATPNSDSPFSRRAGLVLSIDPTPRTAGRVLPYSNSSRWPDNGPEKAKDPTSGAQFKKALGKGSPRWYDASKDSVKVVDIPRDWEPGPSPSWNLEWLGRLITWLFFGIGLALLIGLLVWLWRLYEPFEKGEVKESKKPGEPNRVESLPEGMRREFESTDPWEEAIRRRNRGDLAGAVVCLFAHQLLTMMKLGLVRLAPGRTGRQLLRSVSDAEFRALAMPTLRLFEATYYGHRTPSDEEFAIVWANAEVFEQRVARGVVT